MVSTVSYKRLFGLKKTSNSNFIKGNPYSMIQAKTGAAEGGMKLNNLAGLGLCESVTK